MSFFFVCLFFFQSTFSCTGNVNVSQVVIPTGDQVEKILSVVWKRNTELLNLFACCGKVRSGDDDDGGNGNIVVLQKKKVLTTMLIMFLVSQLLIKATYFLYRLTTCFVPLSSVWVVTGGMSKKGLMGNKLQCSLTTTRGRRVQQHHYVFRC